MNNINIIMPAGALGTSEYDDALETVIRKIAVAASPDPEMEWASKYGTEVDNPVFMMKPYCWCEMDGCKWCSGELPNFYFKPTDLAVRWYKYVGRDTETSHAVTLKELARIEDECLTAIKSK